MVVFGEVVVGVVVVVKCFRSVMRRLVEEFIISWGKEDDVGDVRGWKEW